MTYQNPTDLTPMADDPCSDTEMGVTRDKYGDCATCGFPPHCHEY